MLINLPDGKFIAKAGGADKTPLLKFEKPQSGQYDIWVGSTKKDVLPKAVLKITELK